MIESAIIAHHGYTIKYSFFAQIKVDFSTGDAPCVELIQNQSVIAYFSISTSLLLIQIDEGIFWFYLHHTTIETTTNTVTVVQYYATSIL